MNIEQLNLARKWRSKNFEQIIGQDLSVRILKNSLFLDQYFPVYLFAGQRGCGKTSMARVFAAAVNCDKLSDFQKNPKIQSIPCLECVSCQAFAAGRHPDFIEIDAASNTGVDNVRQIIDSSALLPVMGRKKIYLIDEAHMLSKAAFNAFLKLLEEPPVSVLFILATTDTQKIIDTVRSRCFQLFFKPVDESPLINHLLSICATENISCDQEALVLIVKETSGSVRDAINLLERVRFASNKVTKQVVQQVLGHIDDERVLTCFEIILHKGPAAFLLFSQEHQLEKYSAEYIWNKLVEIIRAALWIKHGVSPRFFCEYTSQIQFLMRGCSFKKIIDILEAFHVNEPLFTKTNAQYPFLEMILLQQCQKNESNSNSGTPTLATPAVASDDADLLEMDQEEETDGQEDSIGDEEDQAQPIKQFIKNIEPLGDQLLISIFTQAVIKEHDTQKGILILAVPKELSFFQDILTSTHDAWHPLLCAAMGKTVRVEFSFEEMKSTKENKVLRESAPVIIKNSVEPRVAPLKNEQKVWPIKKNFYKPTVIKKKEIPFDVSNIQQWPLANLLLKSFPGTISEFKETV